MTPFLIITVVAAVFGLGLWAALRHQRAFEERERAREQQRRAIPRSPTPDEERVEEARAFAEAYRFDPTGAIDVHVAELERDPVRYHGRTVRVVGMMNMVHDGCGFGGVHAFFMNGRKPQCSPGSYLTLVEGLWIYPRAKRDGCVPGFGHMGTGWGELRIYRMASALQMAS